MKPWDNMMDMKARRFVWLVAICCAMGAARAGLKDGLIFYSGFNGDVTAQIAGGDKALYWAPAMKLPAERKAGLPPEGVVTLAREEGKFGDCLKFEKKAPQICSARNDDRVRRTMTPPGCVLGRPRGGWATCARRPAARAAPGWRRSRPG